MRCHCAVVLCTLGLLASFAAAKQPNIVVIVGDDMGYADIGVHGCQDIPTPHIDSLAAGGVRCTSGYVSGAYCSPTRAGLLTGRYQQRFGHEFNPGGGEPGAELGLPLTETTLAEKLKAAGYKTGMVGKWHLGNARQFQPPSRGFEEFYGFLGGARSFFPEKGKQPMYRGYEKVEEKEYLTDAFAREANAFIDRHASEPFFLYLAFNAVHTPLEASDKYLERFKAIEDPRRRKYAAMMSAMDDAIGSVLGKLAEHKLVENTLVFFISDNGGPTAANTANNQPLRGTKAQLWEGGIRVPFLVQWKGKLPAGKTYDSPVISLDIHTTALAAAGVEPKAELDGVDLLPHLAGEKQPAPHDALYWRFGQPLAIRQGDWKLIRLNAKQPFELYNLASDIGEQKNVASEHADLVESLSAKVLAWNKTLAEPLWKRPAPKPPANKGAKKAAKQAAKRPAQ